MARATGSGRAVARAVGARAAWGTEEAEALRQNVNDGGPGRWVPRHLRHLHADDAAPTIEDATDDVAPAADDVAPAADGVAPAAEDAAEDAAPAPAPCDHQPTTSAPAGSTPPNTNVTVIICSVVKSFS